MLNTIIIKAALYLLSLVDTKKIEHKNSWRHYLNKLSEFKT